MLDTSQQLQPASLLMNKESSASTSRLRNTLILAFQILLWWLANNLYAIDAQNLLAAPAADPYLFVELIFAQITFGLCMAFLFRFAKLSKRDTQLPQGEQNPLKPTILIVAAMHFIGTMLTNASYRSVGATGTLVWKLTEPVATIVLKFLLLREATSLLSLVGVQSILCGVFLFSANSLTLAALSPILLANLAFPARNVILKRIQRGEGASLSPIQRFLAMYIPALPVAGLVLLVKIYMFGGNMPSLHLVKNAALFNTYQLASLALLERLDSLTHSLANTLKRFTGVLLTALYFAEPFGVQQVVGLTCTFLGIPIYVFGNNRSRAIATNEKNQLLAFTLLLLPLFFSFGLISTCRSLSSGSAYSVQQKTKHSLTTDKSAYFQSDLEPQTAFLEMMVHVESKYLELPYHYCRSYGEAKNFDDGSNSGNFVWQYAAYLKLPDFSSSTTCNESRKTCYEQHVAHSREQMVMYRPRANDFSPKRIQGFMYELESMRSFNAIPLIFGVGVQAYFTKNSSFVDIYPGREIETSPEDFQFSENSKELLRMMQQRRYPMFFRGDFTLQAARAAGYTHGISNGCPSLMLNEDVRLGETMHLKYQELKKRVGDMSLKVAINIKGGQRFQKWLKRILERYPNSLVYAQGEVDLSSLEELGVPFDRVRFYNNVEQWKNSIRKMDVSIGSRIHGNMVGLGVSVPVFVIAPDHRVLELASRMKIPHTTFFSKDLPSEDVDIAKLVSESGFDGKEFDRNRCEIAKSYRRVFSNYGIDLAAHVVDISNIC